MAQKFSSTTYVSTILTLCFAIATPALLDAQDPPKKDSSKTESKKQDDPKAKDSAKPKQEDKKAEDKKAEDKKADDKKADKKADAKKPATKKADSKKQDATSPPPRTRSSTYRKYNKENPAMASLFQPVIAETSQATVRVLKGTRRIAYGTIVDSSGFILTKSSELASPLKCELPGKKVVEAKLYGIDPDTDLALLKIEEQMLPFVRFDNTVKTPAVGSWLACVGDNSKVVSLGVVSVAERRIPPPRGFMGVQLAMNPRNGGVPVDVVMSGLPADDAGVKKGDIIVSVNGKKTPTRPKLIEIVGDMPPGTRIKVDVLRGEKKEQLEIILGNREELNKEESARANMQNTMSGTISNRRKDFPLAFRHDGVLSRTECGGPVVDLDGKVIGVNIARGGRVESLTLPNAIVNQVIAKLKTGKFTPELVNKEKIEIIKQQLTTLKPVRNSDSKKQRLQAEFDREEAVEESLEKILEDIQKKLDAAKKAKDSAGTKLKDLKKQISDFDKQKKKLEKELERLSNGIN